MRTTWGPSSASATRATREMGSTAPTWTSVWMKSPVTGGHPVRTIQAPTAATATPDMREMTVRMWMSVPGV